MARNKERSEQMRAESRGKILATAQRLFAEHGYNGCSVSDIARQAGMSQGNIYWYFPSKEELFKAVLKEGFLALGSVMAEAAAYPGTGMEKLDVFIERFNALVRDEGGEHFVSIVMTLIAQRGSKRFAELGISTHEIGAGYHRSLNAVIAQCQEEGAVTREIDANVLSTFFFSFMNGLMLMYPDEWRALPTETIHKGALRLLGSETEIKSLHLSGN